MSLCGFQSESYIITVSAVAKLIPKPPARVDNKKAKWGEPGAEKKRKIYALEKS